MLNFTVGPVMSSDSVNAVAGVSSPYFRTPEFSKIMLENERLILKMMSAPENSRCVSFTASGTGAMESCVMNILNDDDKVIVINGGSFGQRFADLCKLHRRDHTEVKCEFGKTLRREQLTGLEDHTAFLVNMHETSSGVLYDMKMISEFCKENGILLIIDAISAFIADKLDMTELGAGAVITGSQKALAVHPGISIVALAPEALKRVESNTEKCMYLSMKEALKNGVRGQTPFTPAVSTLLQINTRLREIDDCGGIEEERRKIEHTAQYFRENIADLPFSVVPDLCSNAVTALHPAKNNARKIFNILKDEYDIWICPNGGAKADAVFRVGHIGNISEEDNQQLIDALHDLLKRDIL